MLTSFTFKSAVKARFHKRRIYLAGDCPDSGARPFLNSKGSMWKNDFYSWEESLLFCFEDGSYCGQNVLC